MRLPWPFGRRAPDGESPAAGDGTPAGTAIGAGTIGGQRDAPSTGAWATLPPIQRTLGTAPLVAPSPPFLADVPGHQPLPPIVRPLGHDSGPAGPPGLVVAHPKPVPSLTATTSLPRPVQRHAPTASGTEPSAPGVPEPEAGPAAAMPAIDAVRTLAPVAPAATVRPAPRPLTQAPPQPVPVQRSGRGSVPATHTDAPSPRPGLAPPLATSGGLPSLPLQRTGARWAEASPVSPGPQASASAGRSGAATTAPVSQPAASPEAPTGAGSAGRRAGLGAPISVPPATAVAQRLPLRPPVRPEAPTRPAATSGPSSATGITPPRPVAAPVASAPARPLPLLPIARQAADSPRFTPAAAEAPPARTTPGAGGRAADPRAAVRPIMGARPLRPSVGVGQRQIATPAGVGATATPGSSPLPGVAPVPARWDGRDELPATITVAPGAGVASARPDLVPLNPLPGSEPDPLLPVSGSQAGLREIVFPTPDVDPGVAFGASPLASRGPIGPAVQRLTATETSPRAAIRGAHRMHASDDAPRTTVGAGHTDLTLARSSPASGTTPAGPATMPGGVPGGATGSTPTVQPTRIESGPGLPPFTATPIVQRVEGSAPVPAGGGEEHSDAELDELAGALFGRIRSRLRAEVVHEREARGLTFDAF